MINLSMLATFIQNTDGRWITKTALNIADSHFEYTRGQIGHVDTVENPIRHNTPSLHYLFSITTIGGSTSDLALNNLPSQLPLAIVLSLLTGAIVWFVTERNG